MKGVFIYEDTWIATCCLNNYDEPLDVYLSTDTINIDLSKFTHVSLFIVSRHNEGRKDTQWLKVDLDHPYLPQIYDNLTFDRCSFVGNFERKITVNGVLTFGTDVSISFNRNETNWSERFISYFKYVKLFHGSLEYPIGVPRTIRYLSLHHRSVAVHELPRLLCRYPHLRACRVVVDNDEDVVELEKIIRENIHRLDASLVDRVYITGDVDEFCISNIKRWFMNYTLVLCFYRIAKKERDLFWSLMHLIRDGYLGGPYTRNRNVNFSDCPDYLLG
jgi:hypothetical protein